MLGDAPPCRRHPGPQSPAPRGFRQGQHLGDRPVCRERRGSAPSEGIFHSPIPITPPHAREHPKGTQGCWGVPDRATCHLGTPTSGALRPLLTHPCQVSHRDVPPGVVTPRPFAPDTRQPKPRTPPRVSPPPAVPIPPPVPAPYPASRCERTRRSLRVLRAPEPLGPARPRPDLLPPPPGCPT